MVGLNAPPRWCRRCKHVHYSTVSDVCEDCWREMGQLSFEIEEEDVIEDDQYHEAQREGR